MRLAWHMHWLQTVQQAMQQLLKEAAAFLWAHCLPANVTHAVTCTVLFTGAENWFASGPCFGRLHCDALTWRSCFLFCSVANLQQVDS